MDLLAGHPDLGDLSRVTLVREKDNVIKYYYLDLTKKNIASSEYYYLLPNDVVIINPIKAKYRNLTGLPAGHHGYFAHIDIYVFIHYPHYPVIKIIH